MGDTPLSRPAFYQYFADMHELIESLLGGFLVDGKPDAAARMWRDGLKIYPLAKAANPPAMEFISGSPNQTAKIAMRQPD